MYKVEFLDSTLWIECFGGYDEQMSLVKAQCFSESNPERKVRVVYENNGQKSVVFFI
jgi:hypothetical protein